MENLKYIRQFLCTPERTEKFKHWKQCKIGSFYLYAHPANELNKISNSVIQLVLLGHFVNPHFPEKTNIQLIKEISSLTSIDEISKFLYSLTGRFVLFVNINGEVKIFHDACGLKSVFYTNYNDNFYAASQPLLINEVVNLKKGQKYNDYYNSEYVKKFKEHYIPCGSSLFDDVYQLVPNHYLDVTSMEQHRYWPNKELTELEFNEAVSTFSKIFHNTIDAANRRFELAVPVTSGWDSRILLSACKDVAESTYFYTYLYRNLSKSSFDITVPSKILKKLGYKHHVIDSKKEIDSEFLKIYGENTDIPHINDWGLIADGIYKKFPKNRVAIKGNCAEIGRCVFYDLADFNPDISSSKGFLNLGAQWEGIKFAEDQIEKWYSQVSRTDISLGYNILDLFYWEQRMGSWQAQAQLEWDVVHDSFTPFNNRELIDIMLCVNEKYRKKPDYKFFTKIIENLWGDVMCQPINPISSTLKAKIMLKKYLAKLGLIQNTKQK